MKPHLVFEPTHHPIFIGGSGRSGTTILCHIFSQLDDVLVYNEPGIFHGAGEGHGIAGLVTGKQSIETYREEMLNLLPPNIEDKFNRTHGDRFPNVAEAFSREKLASIFDSIVSQPGITLNDAIRTWMLTLYQHGLHTWNRTYWVDKTPFAIQSADILYHFFPDMRLVHIIREPKDLASSYIKLDWGPKDASAFIPYYTEMMTRSFEHYRHIPADQYMILSLEHLVEKPEEYMRAIFEFVGFQVSEQQLQQALTPLSHERSHHKRWLENINAVEAVAIEQHCTSVYRLWKDCEFVV